MMTRVGFWVTCFLFLDLAGPIRAATLDDVLGGMEKAGAGLKTFAADFARERVFVIAEDRDSDKGRFYYERSGKMVWEFLDPVVRTVLIEPGRVSIYQPKIKELRRAKLNPESGEFQMVGFGGSTKNLKEKYDVKLLGEGDHSFHLELIPKSIDSSLFNKIELWIDSTRYVPSAVKFYERSTDETTITFTNSQVNPPLSSSRFKLTAPSGTSIIE